MDGSAGHEENDPRCGDYTELGEGWYSDGYGMVMSEKAFPRKSVEACKRFIFQDDDCLINSYHKAGNVKVIINIL